MGCGKTRIIEPLKLNKEITIKHTLIRKPTTKISKEYHFGNKIGTGGFAEVRRCVHKLTGAMRAVKIYKKSEFPSEYLESGGLKQEIEIIKKLDHPNLVKVFEYFEDSDSVYITMEFCLGGELFSKINGADRLEESEICEVMRQLFSVVSYIHSQGIAHRDLKPENILIEEKSQELTLKIADFGNAAIINREKKFKGETGTCYYMAPEVIQNEYTEKCDEWSCAVIMFMLLGRKPPFNGDSDEAILESVKKGEYSLSGPEFDGVSEEAKNLITKILVPEEQRPTASEILAHEWFKFNKSMKTPRKDTISEVNKNLRNFRSSFRLKEAMKTFITSQILTSKDIKPIREVFSVIDSDNDGKISKENLVKYFKFNGFPDADEEAERVFAKIDIEKKGFIEYSQYLKASFDSEFILSQKNLSLAFKMLDTNKQGTISTDELIGAITEENNDDDVEGWRSIVHEASKVRDGTLSLQQFITILST